MLHLLIRIFRLKKSLLVLTFKVFSLSLLEFKNILKVYYSSPFKKQILDLKYVAKITLVLKLYSCLCFFSYFSSAHYIFS